MRRGDVRNRPIKGKDAALWVVYDYKFVRRCAEGTCVTDQKGKDAASWKMQTFNSVRPAIPLFGWSCSKQRESATLCAVTETCVRDDEGEVVSVVCM